MAKIVTEKTEFNRFGLLLSGSPSNFSSTVYKERFDTRFIYFHDEKCQIT